MPSPQSLAEDRARHHIRLANALVADARRLWRGIDPRRIAGSWLDSLPELTLLFTATQLAAAQGTEEYAAAVLAAQDITADPVGEFVPRSVTGVASDGRPLESLLYRPVIGALSGIESGLSVQQSLSTGWNLLETITLTQVADAARGAQAVALGQRRGVGGYVRQIVGATCGRCVVLAGKWFRYNQGFQRHPRCDCVHIPTRENIAGDLTTDPKAWFDSLSRAEQDKQFTRAGAEAIRQGADISRVVNSRRGAYGLAPASRLTAAEKRALQGGDRGQLRNQRVFGRDLFLTTEATTKRGINRKVRLMPESIFQIATSRDDAIRLLRLHGYIL